MKTAMISILLLASLVGINYSSAKALSRPAAADSDDLQCAHVSIIAQAFLGGHVKYTRTEPPPQERFTEQYLKRMDPSKIYLVKDDIKEIQLKTAKQWERILAQDCKFLDDIQKILVVRVKERAEFAKKFLGKDYKFDAKVEFSFDPDKKPYPATKKEAEDFLKKYIHFQISNYLASDMKLDEAKASVTKFWDRSVKRLSEMKQDDIKAGYLDSYARSLDPHSSFFSKDVFEDFEIQMRLSLEGIGATLSNQDGMTVVEALVPGGSAARSGQIQPQDKIIAVAQGEKGEPENVIDMDLRDVVKKIRGAKGTTVRLSILRKKGDGKERVEAILIRDKINLEDEAASITYLDKDVGGARRKIGVLNLPSFYADSKESRSAASDLKKLITQAKENKVEGLVLDLANNGGGSLDDAVKIAGLFFQTGAVVKQSARDGAKGEQALKDRDSAVDWPGPLVVLTSRISASASEIVAGTLKDYKRAVILGNDHTFGKGSVQSVMPVPNNLGAIKVTVGMFFTAGGNSTQHRGVDSDVRIPGPYENDEVGEKNLDYSLPPKTIDAFLSPDAYVKDGPGAWKAIETDWLKTLTARSKERVDKDDEFKKILEEIKKTKSKGKIIKLSDIVKDKDSKEKKEKARAAKNATKEEKEKEYLKRPDVIEATNVLADLMVLESGKSVTAK